MRKFLLTAVLLLITLTFAFAQDGPGRHGQRGGHDAFSQLDLTAEQEAAIKVIRKNGRTKARALRNEGTAKPDREAMKTIREASMQEIEAVLTPAQRTQLAQIKAAKKAEHKDRRAQMKESRTDARAELAQYRKENIKPVIKAARGQLDAFISAEDKATLADLRKVMKTKPGRKKGGKKAGGERPSAEDRAARKEAMATWKTTHAKELETLEGLAAKYQGDIARIQENLKPQRDKWRTEQKAIIDAYRPADAPAKAGKRGEKGKKGHGRKAGKNWPKGAAFLLMKG